MTERSNFLDKEDMMQELDRITEEEHRLSVYRENVLSLYMDDKSPVSEEIRTNKNPEFFVPDSNLREYQRISFIPGGIIGKTNVRCQLPVKLGTAAAMENQRLGARENFDLSYYDRNDNPCHRPHTSIIQPAVNILSKRCMLTPDQMKEFDLLYSKLYYWKNRTCMKGCCKRPKCVVNHALTFYDPEEVYQYTMTKDEFQAMEFKYRFNKKGNFQIKLQNKWKSVNVKFYEFFDETHRGPRCK